jgi:DNA-binding MarR family transcriptional regulator
MAEMTTEELEAQVRTAIARLYSRFRSIGAEDELGEAALSVLINIVKHGPQSLGELSSTARVTPGSMSQTVGRLTGSGHLTREPDPQDKRRVMFQLTRKGRTAATRGRTRLHQWLRGLLDTLEPGERQTLARAAVILHRLADADPR